MGTWIEISPQSPEIQRYIVVPLVGTWIEIRTVFAMSNTTDVVPLVGTWIEITLRTCYLLIL